MSKRRALTQRAFSILALLLAVSFSVPGLAGPICRDVAIVRLSDLKAQKTAEQKTVFIKEFFERGLQSFTEACKALPRPTKLLARF